MYKVLNNAGLLVLTSVVLIGNAQAEGFYFAGNAALFELSDKDIRGDVMLSAPVGRFGAGIGEHFSAELRGGIGVGDDSLSVPGVGRVNVELDRYYGAYLRGGMAATNVIYPYGIVGYNAFKIETSAPSLGKSSDTESDYAFGLGADITVARDFILNLEYMNYFNKNRNDIEGITLGVAKRF